MSPPFLKQLFTAGPLKSTVCPPGLPNVMVFTARRPVEIVSAVPAYRVERGCHSSEQISGPVHSTCAAVRRHRNHRSRTYRKNPGIGAAHHPIAESSGTERHRLAVFRTRSEPSRSKKMTRQHLITSVAPSSSRRPGGVTASKTTPRGRERLAGSPGSRRLQLCGSLRAGISSE